VPKLVLSGAMLQCNQGMAPSTLNVLPTNLAFGVEEPVATVMDHLPMVNVAPFALCISPANPQVAAATAAAMGVLAPQPCVPMVPAPWSPGATDATVGPFAALLDTDTCQCMWAGVIQIVDPATTQITDD
jgi:Domain of unknown function (DUF4280)